MKKQALIALLILPLFFSCIKAFEENQKQKVIDAVTSGSWYVKSYLQDTTDKTGSFNGYRFFFQENGSVKAVKDSTEYLGTWVGDLENRTITSNFAGSPEPMNLLNGTWKIVDSYYDFIVARQQTISGTNVVDLRQN